MNLYEEQVLPRFIDLALRGQANDRLRARVAGGLEGDVVEIGFGSGRNVPFYPASVRGVRAVDPATVGRKLAAKRVATSPVPVDYVGLDGQDLPLDDASIDNVLTTWTLCTIPPTSAPCPVGRYAGCCAPVAACISSSTAGPPCKMRVWQDRLTPVSRRIFGGCHLNRPIDQLLVDSGLEITAMDKFYDRRPSPFSYLFEGVAKKT